MTAVGSDAEAERDLFRGKFGDWLFGLNGDFDLAFPLALNLR
jgi:hypothetical protein